MMKAIRYIATYYSLNIYHLSSIGISGNYFSVQGFHKGREMSIKEQCIGFFSQYSPLGIRVSNLIQRSY